jgi:ribosome-binding protein aMBF1 (putative translation factor)
MKHTIVEPTSEERERLARTAREVELERDEILDEGRTVHERLVAVGAVMREAREAEGVSLAELAARSGVDEGSLSRMENGRQNITLETLDRYSAALGRELSIRLNENARSR